MARDQEDEVVAEIITAVGAALSGIIGVTFFGIARLKRAEAWKIWAERCDPKNPNFRPPLISRKP